MADKVLLIDPNSQANRPLGSGMVTPEQLNISVELTTFRKERSAIAVSKDKKTVQTGNQTVPITFIGGSDLGNNDGKNSLTTHFTELTTNFSKKHQDLETLGIKDIQIEFNSAYAPLIVITFVDVRGKLFEMGKDSPYSVFFELPYPIFNLTVKGYYGKAVTYRLHLTKFNGKFDYSSGSFEVQCNFIGYTYAFLSDIIMGHLKGIPYTKRGAEKVKQKKEGDQGKHIFLTFQELNDVTKSIDGKVMKLKDSNPQLKAIKKSEEVMNKLKNFKNSLNSNLIAVGSSRRITDSNTLGFYPLKTNDMGFGQTQQNNLGDVDEDPLKIDINNYNTVIAAEIKELNADDMLDDGYKLTEDKFLISEKKTIYNKITKNDFNGFVEQYVQNTKSTDRYVDKLGSDKIKYDKFKVGVDAINPSTVGEFIEFKVIDMIDAFDEIDALIKKIENEVKNTIPILGESVLNDSELFTYDGKYFNPTIGNLINLICDHVDIFLDCIRDVAIDAEKNLGIRTEDLARVKDNLDKIDGNLGNLKAFPSYTVEVDGAMVDQWIGNLAPNIPEVKFIEDLLEGIIKAYHNDEKSKNALSVGAGEPQWYPINTFDSIINNVTNPYKKLKDDAAVEDYMRLIILRAIIYLGYSNRHLPVKTITGMGQLEANNAYASIINNDIKAAIKNYASGGTAIRNKIITEAVTGKYTNYTSEVGYTQANYVAQPNRSAIITSSDIGVSSGSGSVSTKRKYLYNYVPVISGATLNYGKNFLPLTMPSYKDYNGDILVKSGTVPLSNVDRVMFRDAENVIFFSDIVGAPNNTPKDDDGGTTIKFFKDKSYIEGKINYPAYGTAAVNTDTKIIDIEQKIIDPGFSNNIFKVKTKVWKELPASLMFYSNDDSNNLPTRIKGVPTYETSQLFIDGGLPSGKLSPSSREKIMDFRQKKGLLDILANSTAIDKYSYPFMGFSVGKGDFTSLFGSDLYYSQDNDKAKAYLFLHTIPFDGLDSKFWTSLSNNKGLFAGDNLRKLFNQKAGFVEMSHAWCLFVGALLSRRRGIFDVKFGDTNMSYIPFINKTTQPTLDQFCINMGGEFFHFIDNASFQEIDRIILNLPESAKKEFRNLFELWVDSGEFKKIQEQCEIFKPTTTRIQRYEYWRTFNDRHSTDMAALYSDSILNVNVRKNYNILLRDTGWEFTNEAVSTILANVASEDNGSPFNFFLEGKDGSNLTSVIFNFLLETRVMANSTWRIWVEADEYFDDGESYSSDTVKNLPIRFDATDLENYLDGFFTEFIKLSENDDITSSKDGDVVKENLFKSVNNDDIKLNLYKKVKSIYDKWICGDDERYIGIDGDELYNSFKFIDRAYNNIEDKFKINLVPMVSQLMGNYNQNFYNYVARVLGDNNFDFIPLPTYINYNSASEVGDVFKTYTYNSAPTTFGPQFICMYIGERSNVLDYGGNFENDSFDFGVNPPSDMTSDGTDNDLNKVPVFVVNYGDENQTIFKDISLDQSEYTATDESLSITESLTNRSSSSGIGQNLFDIYNNRSYTANIEMLGNAMVQPLMHFQLNGVPLFHGAYTIFKVKHYIKPNTMTTNFSGFRIRSSRTKMIDDTTIFMNMFNSLDGISADEANLNDLINNKEKELIEVSQYSKFVTYKFNEGNKPGLVKQAGDVKEYCMKEVGQFIEYVANLWHTQSVGQPYSDKLYYNDLSKYGGGTLGSHKSHKRGTSIDIRQITTDKVVRSVNINDAHYDKAATIKLIQLFKDSQSKFKGWSNNNIIKVIYFDDVDVVNEFGGLVQSIGNHGNHLHIEFNIPQRVREMVAEGDTTSNFDPTITGQLEKIPNGLIPTVTQRKQFLGKV